MNNFKYIFLILCFYVSSAHAQFKVGFKDEDMKDLKRRKLLVVLEEDDEKLIKKLIKKNKPESLLFRKF
jgi:hypothetical protein